MPVQFNYLLENGQMSSKTIKQHLMHYLKKKLSNHVNLKKTGFETLLGIIFPISILIIAIFFK